MEAQIGPPPGVFWRIHVPGDGRRQRGSLRMGVVQAALRSAAHGDHVRFARALQDGVHVVRRRRLLSAPHDADHLAPSPKRRNSCSTGSSANEAMAPGLFGDPSLTSDDGEARRLAARRRGLVALPTLLEARALGEKAAYERNGGLWSAVAQVRCRKARLCAHPDLAVLLHDAVDEARREALDATARLRTAIVLAVERRFNAEGALLARCALMQTQKHDAL